MNFPDDDVAVRLYNPDDTSDWIELTLQGCLRGSRPLRHTAIINRVPVLINAATAPLHLEIRRLEDALEQAVRDAERAA